MTPEETEAQARGRYMALNAVRFGAVLFVMLGFANVYGRFVPDLTPWLGYLFIALGMFEFFFLPKILLRAWKAKDPKEL